MGRKIIAILFAILPVGCSGYKGLTFRVPTVGMSPTIKEGDVVFCDPLYYKHSPLARGDMVVVIDPDGKKNSNGREEMYVKRIVGLGGDKIQIISSKVYVNEYVLDGILGSGKYFSNYPVENFGPVVIPQGEFFLIGDNLGNSYDSRHWKRSTVKTDDIYGKVTQIKDTNTGEIRYL